MVVNNNFHTKVILFLLLYVVAIKVLFLIVFVFVESLLFGKLVILFELWSWIVLSPNGLILYYSGYLDLSFGLVFFFLSGCGLSLSKVEWIMKLCAPLRGWPMLVLIVIWVVRFVVFSSLGSKFSFVVPNLSWLWFMKSCICEIDMFVPLRFTSLILGVSLWLPPALTYAYWFSLFGLMVFPACWLEKSFYWFWLEVLLKTPILLVSSMLEFMIIPYVSLKALYWLNWMLSVTSYFSIWASFLLYLFFDWAWLECPDFETLCCYFILSYLLCFSLSDSYRLTHWFLCMNS